MTTVRGDLLTTVHSSPKETLLDPDLLRGLRGTESSDSSGFSESELEISLRLGFWRPLSSTLGALLRGLGTSAGAALFKEEDDQLVILPMKNLTQHFALEHGLHLIM